MIGTSIAHQPAGVVGHDEGAAVAGIWSMSRTSERKYSFITSRRNGMQPWRRSPPSRSGRSRRRTRHAGSWRHCPAALTGSATPTRERRRQSPSSNGYGRLGVLGEPVGRATASASGLETRPTWLLGTAMFSVSGGRRRARSRARSRCRRSWSRSRCMSTGSGSRSSSTIVSARVGEAVLAPRPLEHPRWSGCRSPSGRHGEPRRDDLADVLGPLVGQPAGEQAAEAPADHAHRLVVVARGPRRSGPARRRATSSVRPWLVPTPQP